MPTSEIEARERHEAQRIQDAITRRMKRGDTLAVAKDRVEWEARQAAAHAGTSGILA